MLLPLWVRVSEAEEPDEEDMENIRTSTVVRFNNDTIFSSPRQDKQYHFKMAQLSHPTTPRQRQVKVGEVYKYLPNQTDGFHVFTIGSIKPSFLNLQIDGPVWLNDTWRVLSDDMDDRNYISLVYDLQGRVYPRNLTYYTFIDENTLLVALKHVPGLINHFDYKELQYFRVYSNLYFRDPVFNTLPVQEGIRYFSTTTYANQSDLIAFISQLSSLKTALGGDYFFFINGEFSPNLDINMPPGSYIEAIYDQSIIDRDILPISEMHSFDSQLHRDEAGGKKKLLVFRDHSASFIEYFDDTDVYIVPSDPTVIKQRGRFYPRHRQSAMSMVTDKDYALNEAYVDQIKQEVVNRMPALGVDDNETSVVIYVRQDGYNRPLVFSNMKIHEFYKLSLDDQLKTLKGTEATGAPSVNDYLAETFENSAYFKVASLNRVRYNTNELSTQSLGYHAIGYYLAYNTVYDITSGSVNVPILYQRPTTVVLYDDTGLMIGYRSHSGLTFILQNPETEHIEFIYGFPTNTLQRLYDQNEDIPRIANEYRVYLARYSGTLQLTDWTDITDNDPAGTDPYVVDNSFVDPQDLTLNVANADPDDKVQVRWANRVLAIVHNSPIIDGLISFPLYATQDRGNGEEFHSLDIPFANIDVFLNGHRLVEGVDFIINFPDIAITTKKYINYPAGNQVIHLFMYGFCNDPERINETNRQGFISHGVFGRNNIYDLYEDRCFVPYIDGKCIRRSDMEYAEEDNTVRINDDLNGLPFTIKEPFIAQRSLTGLPTLPLRQEAIDKDKRLSDFFNLAMPEQELAGVGDMIIAAKHVVYSPTLSRLIEDIYDGNIPPETYSGVINNADINDLLSQEPYSDLLQLDPYLYLSSDIMERFVEIHPHIGNTTIDVTADQYRFIDRVNKILAARNPNNLENLEPVFIVNLSGYLAITTP